MATEKKLWPYYYNRLATDDEPARKFYLIPVSHYSAFDRAFYYHHRERGLDASKANELAKRDQWKFTPWFPELEKEKLGECDPSYRPFLTSVLNGSEKKHQATNIPELVKYMEKMIKDRNERKVQLDYLGWHLNKLCFTPPQPLENQYDVFLKELKSRLDKGENAEDAWYGAGKTFIMD